MTERARRLKKLLNLHERLESIHEARRAAHLAEAAAARGEALALAARFDDPQSLSALFPAVYHNRINACSRRAAEADAAAIREGEALARLRLRAGAIDRAQHQAWAAGERQVGERMVLDWVEGRQAAARSEDEG